MNVIFLDCFVLTLIHYLMLEKLLGQVSELGLWGYNVSGFGFGLMS